MKKLKMIVTSAIILVIVGSAFSFKAKKFPFCVTSNLSSNTCITYIANQKIVSIGTDFKYYPCWDGDGTACTAANNTLCTASFELSAD
jgi:hypothetical protein